MEFVRQQYAGWLGVKNETHCTSGPCTFALSASNEKQLIHAIPSKKEIKQLYDDYIFKNETDWYGFKEFLIKEIQRRARSE